ncbi:MULTISPECIES: hypothetical protein [unclassified Microbacterium]|uniref:hypothetical protein n=1 Tax=unclassified Microbacterium TaxID=2609290 RepID=UPI0030185ADD
MNPYDWMTLLREEGRRPLPPADLPGLFADRHRTGVSLDVLALILSVSWAKGAGRDGVGTFGGVRMSGRRVAEA